MQRVVSLTPLNPVSESLIPVVLFAYIVVVIMVTRKLFRYMRRLNLKENVAIYYNRKLIHILTGGIVAFLVPYLFTSPLIPTLFALALALILYFPYKKKSLLGWFQVSDNTYEVNFCVAWAASLFSVWLLTRNPFYAVVPPLFMSIGDGVTGIIRNTIYGKRTKSWLGNLGMLLVTLPIGLHYANIQGAVASVAATIVEHFELPPVLDDNVLIAITSSLILIALS
ncbi:MAG: dolichol kinase [Desulfurococcaceae archaeon]